LNNQEAKAGILSSAAEFWRNNRQMVNIVFDKLMQYQIVDPTDVVNWTFENGARIGSGLGQSQALSKVGVFEWDLIRGALDKANGRVVIARRKVSALKKEEDDTRARAKARASDGASMEVDGDANPDDVPVDNPQLLTAVKALTTLTRDQKSALSRTLEGFIGCLAPTASRGTDVTTNLSHNPNPHASTVITDQSWHGRANWDNDEWNAWETWSWYRHFCRAYSPYLRVYSNTLYTVSFMRFEGSTDPAVKFLRNIWNVATGQDMS